MRQLFGQQRHLQRRDAAEVIDEHGQPSFTGLRLQGLHQRLDNRPAVLRINHRSPWLTVDPQSQLNMAFPDTPLFIVAARQIAGLHRNPQTPEVVAGLKGHVPHIAERFPLFGGMPGNFMHQRSSGNAARLLVIRQSDIIGHNHHLHFESEALGFFRREAKVETIPGIVFDDQQAATIPCHRHDSVQHRLYAW